MELWFRIFKHLLPRARAWRITIEKALRQFFEGLAGLPEDIRTFLDEVWSDLDPAQTRQLDSWEAQFALMPTGLTEQQRRDRLDGAWKALGGQDPHYIQETLQAAGFDAYVHEWWSDTVIPLVELPLIRNINLTRGNGPATFSRPTTATYLDNNIVKHAAIDEARFEDGRYLNEGPSTNEILHSEDFSNAAWSGAATVATNTWNAPDGTLTGDTLTDSGGSFEGLTGTTTKTSEIYTASIFIEKDSIPRTTRFVLLRIQFRSGGVLNLADVDFDTSNGDFILSGVASSGDVIDYGSYFRVFVTATDADILNSVVDMLIFPAVGASSTWVRDATTTGSVNAWGAQLEALPFRTSYIPTGASTVTRAADILTLPYTGNFPAIGQPVTALINAEFFGDPAANQILWKVVGESSRVSQILSGGVLAEGTYGTATDSVTVSEDTEHRIGYVYDGVEIEASVDGVLSGSPTVADIPTGAATAISLGSDGTGSLPFYGHVTNFRVYDRALTASQLQEDEPTVLPTDPPITRNPFDYLEDGTGGIPFLMVDGGADAQDGDLIAQDGSTLLRVGYPLVNKIVEPASESIGDGSAEMLDGGITAQDGGTIEAYPFKRYEIPADPTKYPYFLYIGGANFPDQADVPAARRDEFEDLCLKICPTEQWLGILANYS